MKTLLELLGQELNAQVEQKLGDVQIFLHEKDQKVIVDDGKLVPYYRIEELTAKNKELKTMLDKSETDLKELKKLATGNEDLTAKIQELQTANKTLQTEYTQNELKLKKSLAVKEALLNAGVQDAEARDLLTGKFDITTLELDEAGKIKDFDAQLKPIKESKTLSKLFGEVKIEGTQPESTNAGQGGTFTRDQVKAMSQEDVSKNLEGIQKSMPSWSN